MYEPCETSGSHSIVVDDSSFLLITSRRIVNMPMYRRHCCPKRIKLFRGWHDVTSRMIWICLIFPALFFLWRCRPNLASATLLLRSVGHTQLDTHAHPVGLSERVTSPSQRPLPAQHTAPQEMKISALSEFKLAIPAIKYPLTHAFRLHCHRVC